MNSVYGAPSYEMASDSVTLSVTQTGGMMGPVTFNSGDKPFAPYALAPWRQTLLGNVDSPLRDAAAGGSLR